MSPPPSAALILLSAWVVVLFAAPTVAAFHQYRTTDVTEIRTPVDAGVDRPRDADRSATGASAAREWPTAIDTHDGDSSSGHESVQVVADD